MTKVINIDSLIQPPPLVLEIKGVRHEMKVMTIKDFIENTKLLSELTPNSTVDEELQIGVKVICRAFPTLTEEEIMGWQIPVIQQVMEIARAGGTVEQKDEVGNG